MNTNFKGQILVTRGGQVESTHDYSFAIFDGKNTSGDCSRMVSLRSTAKPFIFRALIDEVSALELGLTAEEIALMCSSHSGESIHRTCLDSAARRLGISLDQLSCGVASPIGTVAAPDFYAESDQTAKQTYNNCSGKHLAMLIACKRLGLDPKGYIAQSHPVQQRVLSHIAYTLGETPQTAIDGCGVPCFFASLGSLARAYQRLATAPDYAYISRALLKAPAHLSGTARLECKIITQTGIIVKTGTEGIFGAAIPSLGLGLAVKTSSGRTDASEVALIAALRTLPLDHQTQQTLAQLATQPIKSATGEIVGELIAK